MKRFKYVVSLVMGITMIFSLFVSCDKESDENIDKENETRSVVGYWLSTEKDEGYYGGYAFNSDSTGYFYTLKNLLTISATFKIKWWNTDDELVIISDGDRTTYSYYFSGEYLVLYSWGNTWNLEPVNSDFFVKDTEDIQEEKKEEVVTHKYTQQYWQDKYDNYEKSAIQAYNAYQTANSFAKIAQKSTFERAQLNMLMTRYDAEQDGWIIAKSIWESKSI